MKLNLIKVLTCNFTDSITIVTLYIVFHPNKINYCNLSLNLLTIIIEIRISLNSYPIIKS